MADEQNPYTMMGMMQMMQPNKFMTPAQQNSPLSMPGFYGTPTDAMGNPIQSFTDAQKAHDAWDAAHPAQPPGTTLNSTPNAQWGLNNQMYNAMMAQQQRGAQAYGGGGGGGMGAGDLDTMMQANNRAYGVPQQGMGGYEASRIYQRNQANQAYANATGQPYTPVPGQPGSGGSSGAAAPQTNPIDMRQAYLTALSEPQGLGGKVPVQGATTQPSQPLGQPSVLDAFLSTHSGSGPVSSAPGAYSNQGFFNTLNKLRSS